ncbi:Nn.00g065300.m01.CDS01 [Neocucurbitaria sp. VM-36]
MKFLPPALLSLLHLALPALSHASPQPALVSTDWEMSLVPRHTLFLRQLTDLQTFDSALGGTKASPITNSGNPQRPFAVDGDTFDSFQSAAQRSCDNQFQGCSNAANKNGNGNGNGNGNKNGNGSGNGNGNGRKGKDKRQNGGFTVQQCDEQKTKCNNAQQNVQVQDFQSAVASTNIGPDPDFPDFDLICEA